jgi:hypothetical protein
VGRRRAREALAVAIDARAAEHEQEPLLHVHVAELARLPRRRKPHVARWIAARRTRAGQRALDNISNRLYSQLAMNAALLDRTFFLQLLDGYENRI